jgi:AraC family transcriptional regulator of adaptative response/methylated-DNA-[protein]-cysteine methyltransferase
MRDRKATRPTTPVACSASTSAGQAAAPIRRAVAAGAAAAAPTPPLGALQGADADRAWAAVEARDPAWNGRFVYAVASTGIFCRPSCAARRPRRDRVRFFADAAAAAAAGYRACRRCRPLDRGASGAERQVAAARDYLAAHLDETVTLERLGREVGASPYHLQRTFKRLLGLSPKDYVLALRAERLKQRLKEGDDVTTATYEAGYGAGSRLYEQSNARLGMTPGTFRRGGRGAHIRFALAAAPPGRLLVAATERGICAVRLGDDDRELAAGLGRDFPQATLEQVGADDPLTGWVEAILASLSPAGAAPPPLTALPLDVRATAFEWRVWRELQRIPRGATRSYGEVAAALGKPTAARAVARACAANRVALVVPCHRVVRADGDPGGYRWGSERKRQLLAGEGALATAAPAGEAVRPPAAAKPGAAAGTRGRTVPRGALDRVGGTAKTPLGSAPARVATGSGADTTVGAATSPAHAAAGTGARRG